MAKKKGKKGMAMDGMKKGSRVGSSHEMKVPSPSPTASDIKPKRTGKARV